MTDVLRYLFLGAALNALVPAAAAAQVASSFDQLQGILRAGQRVVVTDDGGRDFTGKITAISGSSFATDGRIFAASAVTKVRRTDPLWDGALIGAGVGGAVFGLGRMNCERNHWDCNAAQGAENWIPGSLLTAWLCPLTGGIVGALIDKARGNEVIYHASGHASRLSIGVSPVLGHKSVGGTLLMKF